MNQLRMKLLPIVFLAFLSTACMPLGQDLVYDSSQPELVAFSSCGDLQNFLQVQAFAKSQFHQSAFFAGTNYDSLGFMGAAPLDSSGATIPTPDSLFSQTNLQEMGVDEADIFKVDATHAFALHGDRLVIIGAEGELAPDGDVMLQIEDAAVVADVEVPGEPIEMFLADNRVIVITHTTHQDVALLVGASAPSRPSSTSVLEAVVFDVSDRSKPVIAREVAIEGEYLASRRIGDHVYFITRSPFEGPDFESPISGETAWLLGQQAAIRSASLDAWLPYQYDVSRDSDGAVSAASVDTVDCTSTYSSKATNGDQALTVTEIDIADPKRAPKTTTILGDGAVVYASTDSIVVALTNYGELVYGEEDTSSTDTSLFTDFFGDEDDDWFFDDDFSDWEDEEDDWSDDGSLNDPAGREVTYVHRFRIEDDGSVNYHATGSVEGWILNQFSLSEYQGYVRVATMKNRGASDAESMIHVLQTTAKSGVLQAPLGNQSDFLNQVGYIGEIGYGEDLYAARFKQDVAYLVTFREWDPLHIIDLREPTSPRERGELEIPGFSTYLHPIANNQLLAVGRAGEDDGIKISHFDVSDLDNPRVIDEETYGFWGAESEALDEHHAFAYFEDVQLMALPMDLGSEKGMYTFGVNEQVGFSFMKRIDHSEYAESDSANMLRRTYRIGDFVYLYSAAGVTIHDIGTMNLVTAVDLEDAN